jgi:hypothetical protein
MVQGTPHRPEAPKGVDHTAEKQADRASETTAASLGVGVDTRGILDAVDGAAEGTEAMGHVSESAHEGIGEQRQSSGGKFQQFQQQLSTEEAAALKAKLLQSPPTRKQMVEQIRIHVHREIEQLEVIRRRSAKEGRFKELVEAMRRLRQLKTLLHDLAHATVDFLRNTWLKVVHGIV